MIIRCILSLVTVLILPIWGQIPPQPIVTTTSACLNECLEQGSAVFAAANLRNFQKIILNVEEFCNTREKLLKCAQSCSDEERTKLDEKINLSTYICTDKLEEFRLVRECMEGQEEGHDDVSGCATECGHPSDATVQLDSSPAAPVNPFAFIDSITPVCRTIECVMKCSIKNLNKRCPGSGYLFRDIGYKQVLEASRRLHNEASNLSPPSTLSSSLTASSSSSSSSLSSSLSSSTSSSSASLSSSITEQLAKTYLESLPEPCSYIINTLNYNMTFPQDEASDDSGMITEAVDVAESMDESVQQTTPEMINTDNAHLITSLFNLELTTQTAKISSDEVEEKEEMEKETTMNSDSTVTTEMINKPDSELESSPVSSSHTDVEHIMESEIKGIISSAVATSTEIGQAGNAEEEKDMKSGSQEEERKEDEGHEHHEDEEKEEDEMRIGSTVSSSQMETVPTIVVQKSSEHDEEEDESKEKTSDDDLQQFSTPVVAQETTERTIIVVNDDDKDQEIDTNTIQHRDHIAEQQKDQSKKGVRERITISLLLILPLFSLYFSSQ